MNEEIREKISRGNKGKPKSEEHKQKLKENNAKYWLGKHHSEETRKKISESHKGLTHSEETKKKLREIREKLCNNPEYLQKISKKVDYPKSVYTKDFCYLIGVLYGDGSLGICNVKNKNHKHYFFSLTTKDKEFIEKFNESVYNVFGINSKINLKHNKEYNKDYYYISIQRINLVKFMLKYKNFEFIKSLNKDLKIQVLKGIFDSEGSITNYNRKRIKKQNGKEYKYVGKELLVRIAQIPTSKAYLIIKYLLDFFEIKYSYTGKSFNIWCRQGVIFLNLLGDITIKRKVNNYYSSKNYKVWNKEEIKLLKENHLKLTYIQIAEKLRRTQNSIAHKLKWLKVQNVR